MHVNIPRQVHSSPWANGTTGTKRRATSRQKSLFLLVDAVLAVAVVG